MNFLLDTDALIYFLRGNKKIKAFLLSSNRFYYSYITKKELLKKTGLSSTEEGAILRLLNRLRQIPVDASIAERAEHLLKSHRTRGLHAPDALIAATAMTRNLTLVTFNHKHFHFIPKLSLFPVDTLL